MSKRSVFLRLYPYLCYLYTRIKMTKFLIPLLCLLVLTLFSCNEDVNVSSTYKESPVIYGLLDQNNDIHYIKINRGFVGPGNALEFSKIPDSNYFENVSAKVEELINNVPIRTWELRDTLLTTKDTNGVFFGPDQIVYYFDNGTVKLKEEAVYRLTVDINEGKLQVVGETKIVSQFGTNTSISNQTANLKLAKDPGEYLTSTIWANAGSAVFGSITVEIDVAEIRGADTTFIRIPWKIGENTTNNNKLTASGLGETFYRQIRDGLTNDNTISRRNLMGLNVKFIGGSNEFYNYILVNKPSSTLTQTKPIYTNLTVTNGFKVVGLFSARHTVDIYKPFEIENIVYIRAIDQNSTRELCEGSLLAPYLFCSQHSADNIASNPKSYACP